MKRKILVLVVAAFMMLGSAMPALATHTPSGGPDVEPVCGWDWDRYLWRTYAYELWYYGCDYGEDNGWYLYAFWNPDNGYWYP